MAEKGRRGETGEFLVRRTRPSVEVLKRTGTSTSASREHEHATEVRELFGDKQFVPNGWGFLNSKFVLGTLFTNLVIRSNRPDVIGHYDRVMQQLPQAADITYDGRPSTNAVIDGAINSAGQTINASDPMRAASGIGASTLFELGNSKGIVPEEIRQTPIAIFGAGPAGVLTARSLIEMGFRNIKIFDPKGEYGGIWTQPNTVETSKNNPRAMTFLDITLDQTQDTQAGTGQQVKQFVDNAVDAHHEFFIGRPMPEQPVKGKLISVVPSDLDHLVTYEVDGRVVRERFPITVMALGAGQPLPVSDPARMVTDSESAREAGQRWQKRLTAKELERFQGKQLVFIGLGNSTAEMLVQIREANEAIKKANASLPDGQKKPLISFKVLTHHSMDDLIGVDQGTPRIFRNLGRPNLTGLAGDLPAIRQAFEEARDGGQIRDAVREWHIVHTKVTDEATQQTKDVATIAYVDEDGNNYTIPYDKLYTLIGYGHSEQTLNQLGVSVVQPDRREIGQDWDGEVQAPAETEEDNSGIYQGLYVIGAMRQSATKKNSAVVPGILHDLPDTLFGITMRAAQWYAKQRVPLPQVLRELPPAQVEEPEREEPILGSSRRVLATTR